MRLKNNNRLLILWNEDKTKPSHWISSDECVWIDGGNAVA